MMSGSLNSGMDPRLVKDANKAYYDLVADTYERIDGRRSESLQNWLRGRLGEVRAISPGGRLLDLGAGAGFASRCAEAIFDSRTGVDLSPKILTANRSSFDSAVACDVDHLPFRDGSFDAIICFATLHHLPLFETVAAEARRVLQPGGVFYSDHDLDSSFVRRHWWLLKCYRALRNPAARASMMAFSMRLIASEYSARM